MTYSDILLDIDFLSGSNTISYPIIDKTRNSNLALDKVASLIQKADSKWDWEDTNNSDLPVGSTNIVAGQQDYSIDTTFLKIKGVFYTDENGNKTELEYVEDKNYFLTLTTQDIGIPMRYTILGNSIMLDCFPTKGTAEDADIKLTVYFARSVHYFTTSDTTAIAGFNPQFHRYISLSASYDYASIKKPDIANRLRQEMLVMEKEILAFYSGRQQIKNKNFGISGIDINNYK